MVICKTNTLLYKKINDAIFLNINLSNQKQLNCLFHNPYIGIRGQSSLIWIKKIVLEVFICALPVKLDRVCHISIYDDFFSEKKREKNAELLKV